jgi:hypothetical protein
MHGVAARGAPAAVGALPRVGVRRPRRTAATYACAAADAPLPPSPPLRLLRPEAPLEYGGGGAMQFVIPNARRAAVEPPPSDGFCFACRATDGIVTCADCSGSGTLARGGYTRSNPVALKNVVGSKWTAHESTFGWRHFVVLSRRKEGSAQFVEARARGLLHPLAHVVC